MSGAFVERGNRGVTEQAGVNTIYSARSNQTKRLSSGHTVIRLLEPAPFVRALVHCPRHSGKQSGSPLPCP